ncbi:MAG TPA: FliH/SctL family protein [Syntrophorhabdus sp.]|jgi:flagellar assembly protein FliH|nr:FliH/SctL family protein [Syntrophorhabdus sp.]
MRNLSKGITVYKIDPFAQEESSKQPEFMSIFDDSGKKAKNDDKPNSEEQARKIFEDAFVQGEKAGYEMGMKKIEQIAKRLNSYITELDLFKDKLLKQAESFSMELALIFAEALVLRECSEKKGLVMDMAKRAFEICEDKHNIVIRVRPEDAEYLSKSTTGHLKIVPDDTLKEPGFIVETEFGDIDGRLSVQLEELRKEFLNVQPE